MVLGKKKKAADAEAVAEVNEPAEEAVKLSLAASLKAKADAAAEEKKARDEVPDESFDVAGFADRFVQACEAAATAGEHACAVVVVGANWATANQCKVELEQRGLTMKHIRHNESNTLRADW